MFKHEEEEVKNSWLEDIFIMNLCCLILIFFIHYVQFVLFRLCQNISDELIHDKM